jgi:hypothetical protein
MLWLHNALGFMLRLLKYLLIPNLVKWYIDIVLIAS